MLDLVALLAAHNKDYRRGRKRCEDDEGSECNPFSPVEGVDEGAFLFQGARLSESGKWPGRAAGSPPHEPKARRRR